MNSSAGSQIIIALDLPTEKAALAMVEQLRPEISFFKIGLQLYTVAGPQIVREVRAGGAKVFLDLKLHDIPNTVSRSVSAANDLGVEMLTIHLSGGTEMVRAAVEARSNDLLLLGVTVLTSATRATLQETGVDGDVSEQVERLANLGVAAGVQGFVASPKEAKTLRAQFADRITIVTPGVRPRGSEPADQQRVMTPAEAIAAGADYLVIGRPVTAHPRPEEAVAKIIEEITRRESSDAILRRA